MPINIMADDKDSLFVMSSLSDRPQGVDQQHYLSSESLEDHHSTTSSTESNPSGAHRKDHEFIPTRMKTIAASKPASDPKQFTRIPSNPLLISATKQMMQVDEVKKLKKKESIVPKRGDDEPDWQSNLSSWKDKRRKQSEEALQRVAEVKALESGEEDFNQRQKISIGKKLSSLLYTNGEDDWSEILEKTPPSAVAPSNQVSETISENPAEKKRQISMPILPSYNEPVKPVTTKEEAEETTQLVKQASRNPVGYFAIKEDVNDGYGEGIPVLNRKTSAPVLPYGSPRSTSEEKEPPPVRRKSSELSTSMKSRLELFMKQDEEDNKNQKQRVVEPDNTFREKLQTFRKISEPQPEDNTPKGPKPTLSYKTLLGGPNFSQQPSNSLTTESSEDHDDSVDQLLDDALEESYRELEDGNEENLPPKELLPGSNKKPPSEKPPPIPPPMVETTSEETVKNQRNLSRLPSHNDVIDKQEREIIESLELEEREHKKYMDTVNAMRNLSPGSSSSENSNRPSNSGAPQPFAEKVVSPTFRNVSPALSGSSESSRTAPIKKKSSTNDVGRTDNNRENNRPAGSYNQQHWLIQEAEQRRIAEQQLRQQQQQLQQQQQQQQQQQSPVYENSNYVGGMQVPPPNQYTNHQRPPSSNGMPHQQPPHHQQPPLNENLYANLGQHPPLPPNFQREIPPGPPTSNMRGLPGPQVPPRNPPSADGKSSNGSNDRLLSVSGKKKCSHCKEELGRGAAMIIESLRLFYHLRCFRCVVCHVQLGNGATGTDVRVRNNKLHCQNCYSNDEGLKFSKV